ncbi:hypothetical protein ABVT39_001914 [Epinephelus coioides]
MNGNWLIREERVAGITHQHQYKMTPPAGFPHELQVSRSVSKTPELNEQRSPVSRSPPGYRQTSSADRNCAAFLSFPSIREILTRASRTIWNPPRDSSVLAADWRSGLTIIKRAPASLYCTDGEEAGLKEGRLSAVRRTRMNHAVFTEDSRTLNKTRNMNMIMRVTSFYE